VTDDTEKLAYLAKRKRKNAAVTTHQLVNRRYTKSWQDSLRVVVLHEQGGECASCDGQAPQTATPQIDWDPYERSEDGGPLLRGALCRSCKTALNRLMEDYSQYRPNRYQEEWLESYLARPLRTPEQVLPGIVRDAQPAVVADRAVAGREWLEAQRQRLTGQSGPSPAPPVSPGAPGAPGA
jgi:hypothetical protein